ncbi:MAG TPA: hypothetical protein VGJ38_08070 [Jatrophihabitantaceae bacterium]
MRRVLVVAVAVTLTGCTVGRPSGFTARSDDTCRDATKVIEALHAPRDAVTALGYALDRYTAVERAVSTLTDSSLPAGQRGRELRERWLRPARASLEAAGDELLRLRDAVRRHDDGAVAQAFADASEAGTHGVDTTLLRARGLTDCATLFSPHHVAPGV